MDLLEHEVLVAALFSSFCVPLYLCEFLLDLLTVDVVESYSALFKLSYFIVADVVNVSCVLEDSRNV